MLLSRPQPAWHEYCRSLRSSSDGFQRILKHSTVRPYCGTAVGSVLRQSSPDIERNRNQQIPLQGPVGPPTSQAHGEPMRAAWLLEYQEQTSSLICVARCMYYRHGGSTFGQLQLVHLTHGIAA